MSPTIHVEWMMHRARIAVPGEPVLSHALIKLTPNGGTATSALRLNLALVIDVSGSMYERDDTGLSRLERVQTATKIALAHLRAADSLTLIAFAKDAMVVLPPTPLAEGTSIEAAIQTIDALGVDPGGTSMDLGIALGLQQLASEARSAWLSHLIVLTDGETTGESLCHRMVREAAQRNVGITLLGVGTDSDVAGLKELARSGHGRWRYADVRDARAIERTLAEEFAKLAALAFDDVKIEVRLRKDVRIQRFWQVTPEIKEYRLLQPDGDRLIAGLGHLEGQRPARFLLDMLLPKRPAGRYAIAQVAVSYHRGSDALEATETIGLEMLYATAGDGYINAEVARDLDEVRIFELNNQLQQALAKENPTEAAQLAEHIAQKAELLGPRATKKTLLAKQVLEEVSRAGHVSRRTQLAVDDAARLVEYQ